MEYPSESFVKHILCTIYPVTCLYIHIHQNCALNVRKHRKGNKINGQSRETGNVGYTRHRTKTNKTKSTLSLDANKHK